jgi:hypothetical protein
MTSSTGHWTRAAMAALDLEGSGAQDHEDEAILEIAVVPLAAGQPDTAAAYTTFINPGRRIPRRPWISPGLTTAVLAAAPGPARARPPHQRAHHRRPQHRRRLAPPAPLLPRDHPGRAHRHLPPGPPPQARHQEQPQRPDRPARPHSGDRAPRARQPAPSGPVGHHRRSRAPARAHRPGLAARSDPRRPARHCCHRPRTRPPSHGTQNRRARHPLRPLPVNSQSGRRSPGQVTSRSGDPAVHRGQAGRP